MSRPDTSGPFTLVSFHAHPDDEALLTGGTLARAAAEGHRVVLVTATAGESGLAEGSDGPSALALRRRAELAASAHALGVARVVELGYPDSGYGGTGPGQSLRPFSDLPPEGPAARLAEVLREEQADVLTSYDAAGGYGHPDHVQVHRVGALAAAAARTPVLLEATVDRDSVARVVRLLRTVSRFTPMPELPDLGDAFTARSAITHQVDVRPYLAAKLAALRAHVSQSESDQGLRTIALLLRLPAPLRARVLGREWFRDARGTTYAGPVDDVFASLRAGSRADEASSQVDGRSPRSSSR